MSTGKPRDASKERFWRRMLRQWRCSGLSARKFCQQRGLSQPSLYAWQRTIAKRDAQTVHFVPVQVLPQEKPTGTGGANASGLELLLKGGRILRIGPAFDEPTLKRLLALLEEGQP
jgi:hypothetical protein